MSEVYDYVVIGSGAGGGPVAARLAEAGFEVLLLEAGGQDGGEIHDVPAFHALASEHEDLRWDYYVRHWDDDEQQRRDSKFLAGQNGVWYPRAGSLGGCSAVGAMIAMCPHDRDWEAIARATGDRSWRPRRMRRWFERLERRTDARRPLWLPRNDLLAALVERLPLPGGVVNRDRRGFDGWLRTTLADPAQAVRDPRLRQLLLAAAEDALAASLGRPVTVFNGLDGHADPNERGKGGAACEGLWRVPLAVGHGRRSDVRDLVDRVATLYPNRLVVRTGCLATRVLFDGTTAVGVEYVDERHVYRADPRAPEDIWPPPTKQVEVRGEVVLAAGAFNTPQLLMLSGIGPRPELEQHCIDVRVDLPGVGANLSDHYQAAVVFELGESFSTPADGSFNPPRDGGYDRALLDWTLGKGSYTTNGALVGVTARSQPELAVPDLFLYGMPVNFRGYYPGYAHELDRNGRYFTWTVLKARTVNRAGRVELASADPRVPPRVSFRYFDEGDDAAGEDLDAVVRGIELARDIMRRARDVSVKEILPGETMQSIEDLRRYVRDEAWGQHACGTARMGTRKDPGAVVDSRFRVLGTQRLRVVDASVFPHVPGFFLAVPVAMIAEKAAAKMIDEAARYL